MPAEPHDNRSDSSLAPDASTGVFVAVHAPAPQHFACLLLLNDDHCSGSGCGIYVINTGGQRQREENHHTFAWNVIFDLIDMVSFPFW